MLKQTNFCLKVLSKMEIYSFKNRKIYIVYCNINM